MIDNDIKKERYGCIYQITNNITQQIYIGRTIHGVDERWREHIIDANNYRDNALLHSDMRKYGYENFSIQIIEDNIIESQLDNKEKYYIELLKSRKEYNNYNMTDGGSGTYGCSKLDKNDIEKIYAMLKDIENYPFIDEIAQIFNVDESTIAKINKGVYWKNEYTTYPIRKTKLTRRDKGRSKGKNNPRAHKVRCIELNKTFDTINEANEYLGVKYSHISGCCRGECKTSIGYHWEYAI